MRSPTVFSASLIAAAIFILPVQSLAQYTNSLGVPFNNPISATMSTMIWGHINRAALQQSQRTHSGRSANTRPQQNRGTSSTTARTLPAPNSGPVITPSGSISVPRNFPAIQFKPTGTRLVLDEYLKNVQVSAADKAELRELVPAIWTVYEEEAALKGYPNDVALAFVSFIVLNTHVYEGRTEKLSHSFGQNVDLRNMLAEQTTKAGSFADSTDREKQELYEVLVMFGGLTMHQYLDATKKNDTQALKELKTAAALHLKLIGIQP